MRDKDSGKKIFWIYPTNKFVGQELSYVVYSVHL